MSLIIFLLVVALIAIFIYAATNPSRLQNEPEQQQVVEPASNNPNAEVQELKFFCIKDKGYHVSVWPKDVYQPDFIEFEIAGITHHADVAMKHLGESMALLVAEPDNPYDPNAIRVMTSDWQLLGYVPRDMTDIIHEHTSGSTCPCFIYIGYREDDDIFYTDAYINLNLIKK
ncbi:MAG: HIRAN domain-containing protein [Bacteroidales bacterium]|nr:HIRAN domain-containing protein [Bacteroidaceae bacterium]MBO5707659.1 HIRAN domain-containing protein [Bacteroidaceae bacterium]MBO7528286.1 HIRAN domain-containing protein [Bacteroidales bacterium]MBO7528547.1 HIRAN domain-containing protein [Bacteroidales bacterium]